MAINHEDGQYGLDIYESKPQTEYSDNLSELKARAAKLIEAGRFKYLVLSRWNASTKEWVEIEEIEAD
jgi:hypothetical protein